jgi:hypothetical protein
MLGTHESTTKKSFAFLATIGMDKDLSSLNWGF